jgi:predicted RNA binding protein YcfA (HicA-like mRNA interferase family)
MTRHDKLLERILCGTSDANIPFAELCQLLYHLGFDERIRGSHHIFTQEGIREIMNIQPRGTKAKPYQVKQVRELILRYKFGGEYDPV